MRKHWEDPDGVKYSGKVVRGTGGSQEDLSEQTHSLAQGKARLKCTEGVVFLHLHIDFS